MPDECTGGIVLDAAGDYLLLNGVCLTRPDRLYVGRIDWRAVDGPLQWVRLGSGDGLPPGRPLESHLHTLRRPDGTEYEATLVYGRSDEGEPRNRLRAECCIDSQPTAGLSVSNELRTCLGHHRKRRFRRMLVIVDLFFSPVTDGFNLRRRGRGGKIGSGGVPARRSAFGVDGPVPALYLVLQPVEPGRPTGQLLWLARFWRGRPQISTR